ncbi:Uu.00g068860.m01.CDS01 [Anthostomella pinea]|uniref:Uu.00g068860.m01.CDS01 n=1 Tax=Anthostomella pinea TaxID=933095 RepID=A0AAI8VNT6_9PEZI|nr:Uu.00g068860.m01.CDS01 [Anthostomella pinea]
MSFSPTFGDFGDFISISLLINDLIRALSDSRGSTAEYQTLAQELCLLNTALLQMPELQALRDLSLKTAQECRNQIQTFSAKINKYETTLGSGSGGSAVKTAARKIQWLTEKSDVSRFRAEIMGQRNAISLLLATTSMKLLQQHHEDVTKHNEYVSKRLDRVDRRIDVVDNKVSSLGTHVTGYLDSIKTMGVKLTHYMMLIMHGNVRIYSQMLAWRTTQATGLARPPSEEFFVLIDAVGREAPVHLRLINSWEALNWVLLARFKDWKGAKRVAHGRYALQDHTMSRDIKRSMDFEAASLPGQTVAMSIECKRNGTSEIRTSKCPKCGSPLSCRFCFTQIPAPLNVPTNAPYQRNSSPKGQNNGKGRTVIISVSQDTDSSDEEDLVPFKRVRLIEAMLPTTLDLWLSNKPAKSRKTARLTGSMERWLQANDDPLTIAGLKYGQYNPRAKSRETTTLDQQPRPDNASDTSEWSEWEDFDEEDREPPPFNFDMVPYD